MDTRCIYLFILISWFSLPLLVGGFVEEFFFNQTVDHFGYGKLSEATFSQRYFMDSTNWSGQKAGGPIFVFFNGPQPLGGVPNTFDFLNNDPLRFRPLLVYIEHRFYGQSVPTGSIDQAMNDTDIRGCLSSAQALADYAEIILSIKASLEATHSPVIVVGGFYGGMLAAWFRLTYPHIAIGALASSAPILYFEDIPPEDSFCSIVSRDFKETNEECYNIIGESWSAFDNPISFDFPPLDTIHKVFNTCRTLDSVSEVKDALAFMYMVAATNNGRFNDNINSICNSFLAAAGSEKNVTKGMVGAVTNAFPPGTCFDIDFTVLRPSIETDSGSVKPWDWQLCSELLIPISCDSVSMFPPMPFDLNQKVNACKAKYGVSSHPNWIKTYFGGDDIKTALKNSASNIIFSNGLRDPFSSFGILEDISDTIVALATKEGSHTLDLRVAQNDDPKWLVHQRRKEMEIMEHWIKEFHLISSSGLKLAPLMLFLIIWVVLLSLTM